MYLRWSLILGFWTGCMGVAPPDVEGVDDDDSGSPDVIRAVATGTARVVNTDGLGLRLRTGPASTYAVIALMPEGSTVKVLEAPSGAWYRVDFAGQVGWAHGSYLQSSPVSGGKNNLLPWTANTAFMVTQGHNGGSHTGLGAWAWDFGLPAGTPVLAAHVGTVRLVKGNSTVGGCSSAYANDANFVIVDQGNGYESLYLHLGSVGVAAGQSVQRGDLLGYSGQSGWSCGAHLHFQVQLSPSNGGGTGFYNPSINDVFYDTGVGVDPVPGTVVTSKNGVSTQPRTQDDPHGDGDGAAWDLAMQAAGGPQ